MPALLDPALCTETLDENYTVGTFDLYLTPSGGQEFLVGNIVAGSEFAFDVEVLEHRLGKTNALDAVLALSKDYTINFTTDSITARNLAALLNETAVTVSGECKIPLIGERCVTTYGVRLVHEFPCATKSFEITFWRAQILAPFTMTFGTEFAQIAGSIRALSCESIHPAEPYGKIEFSQVCPTS
jgi:hypothetical protein